MSEPGWGLRCAYCETAVEDMERPGPEPKLATVRRHAEEEHGLTIAEVAGSQRVTGEDGAYHWVTDEGVVWAETGPELPPDGAGDPDPDPEAAPGDAQAPAAPDPEPEDAEPEPEPEPEPEEPEDELLDEDPACSRCGRELCIGGDDCPGHPTAMTDSALFQRWLRERRYREGESYIDFRDRIRAEARGEPAPPTRVTFAGAEPERDVHEDVRRRKDIFD